MNSCCTNTITKLIILLLYYLIKLILKRLLLSLFLLLSKSLKYKSNPYRQRKSLTISSFASLELGEKCFKNSFKYLVSLSELVDRSSILCKVNRATLRQIREYET